MVTVLQAVFVQQMCWSLGRGSHKAHTAMLLSWHPNNLQFPGKR